jgi:glyceraldehyde 3-phosphate dehydrogenase
MAFRVPSLVGSISDLTAILRRDTTEEEINEAFKEAAENDLKGIMETTEEALVSRDIIGNPHSVIVQLDLTKVVGGNMVKVVGWYDNEWGYANRLVELAEKIS